MGVFEQGLARVVPLGPPGPLQVGTVADPTKCTVFQVPVGRAIVPAEKRAMRLRT
jgi:hypothetical protein